MNKCAIEQKILGTTKRRRRRRAKTKKSRQRSTLPHSHPCSTIDAKELNFRVRDGIGCGLFAIITGKIVEESLELRAWSLENESFLRQLISSGDGKHQISNHPTLSVRPAPTSLAETERVPHQRRVRSRSKGVGR